MYFLCTLSPSFLTLTEEEVLLRVSGQLFIKSYQLLAHLLICGVAAQRIAVHLLYPGIHGQVGISYTAFTLNAPFATALAVEAR